MFSATSLLLLACACAVAINAQVDDKCISAQIGVLNNIPGQYAQAQVLDKVSDVYLENHPQCNNDEAGVFAWVCDNDVPPSAYFKDFNHLVVTRNGACEGSATVDATAYCKE